LAKLEIGDIFRLPVDAHRVGYGQIVGRYGRHAYYFAIFEQPHDVNEDVDAASLVDGKIALLALSLDALLSHGEWEVVGHADPPAVRWPTYKEATAPDIFEAVDHTGQHRRPISKDEASSLPNRRVVAPIRVQNAFRSLHGAGPWHEAYDQLRY
jgi:Immunity protein 26